jgi:hypothetical protein
MNEFTLPIVGLWFKPPAMKLVKLLPLNTNLELIHEPNNQVDPNAVAVWLTVEDLKLSTNSILSHDLREAIESGSWLEKSQSDSKVQIQAETFDEFRELAYFQLGYIGAENARLLVQRKDWPGKVQGRLVWPQRSDKKSSQAAIRFSLG